MNLSELYIYLVFPALALLLPFLLLRYYVELSPRKAFGAGLAIGATAVAVAVMFLGNTPRSDGHTLLVGMGRAFTILFGLPLAMKLHAIWLAPSGTTVPERLPGKAGVRASLAPAHLLVAGLLAAAAAYGYECSWFSVAVGLLLLLLAGPLVQAAWQQESASSSGVPEPGPATPVPPEDLTPERQRVLALLEAGRISAEECAELLHALGATRDPAVTPSLPWPALPRPLLLSGACLLFGFFLPWLAFDPGREVQRQMNSMLGSTPFSDAALPNGLLPARTLYVSGGEVPHGLGWGILLLGLGAAALPVLGRPLPSSQVRLLSRAALALGGFLLLYLLVEDFRYLHLGFLFTVLGYLLQALPLLRPAPVEVPNLHSGTPAASYPARGEEW